MCFSSTTFSQLSVLLTGTPWSVVSWALVCTSRVSRSRSASFLFFVDADSTASWALCSPLATVVAMMSRFASCYLGFLGSLGLVDFSEQK
jgi:hypothetical protein